MTSTMLTAEPFTTPDTFKAEMLESEMFQPEMPELIQGGFDFLNLDKRLNKALEKQGYTIPTPIQQQAIPLILEGKDILGCAQTGTGKTAAFSLPILQLLLKTKPPMNPSGRPAMRPIRALILSPTRELAGQIAENVFSYGQFTDLRHTVVFGGVKQFGQVQRLRRGVDVLVATPGRLMDLMNQGFIDLSKVEILVLDEADRMLDMGFIHDIRKIISKIPTERQTLLFSATMPREIQGLADAILNHPARIEVAPVASTVELIEQQVYFVDQPQKPNLLKQLLEREDARRVLIFTRTRHGADRIVRQLEGLKIQADAFHSDKSQNARQAALSRFKSGRGHVMVATDIAARGIDVDEISHVINYDMPNEAETYVHRIGRTGRAGSAGVAISFCDISERMYLRVIEKTIRKKLTQITEHEFASSIPYVEVADTGGGGNRNGKGRSFYPRNASGRRRR